MSVWLPSAPCTPRACVEATGSATAVPRAVLRLAAVRAARVHLRPGTPDRENTVSTSSTPSAP
ncbi:hypothetical protein ABT086_20180, partial [Streptomyces mirabilis]